MTRSVSYRIRPIGEADQAFLWEMLYQALFVPEGAEPLPREIVKQPEIARYVAEWGRSGDRGFIAIEEGEGKAIGAVWERRFSASEKGYGFVAEGIPELSIAILPGYRNRGIGTALLERLIGEKRGDRAGVSLSVSAENPAIRLYRRLGFREVEVDGSSVIMVLAGEDGGSSSE